MSDSRPKTLTLDIRNINTSITVTNNERKKHITDSDGYNLYYVETSTKIVDLNNRIEFAPGPASGSIRPDYILFTEKDRKEEEELLRRAFDVYADGYTMSYKPPEKLTISEIEKAESAINDAEEMVKFVKFIKGNNDTNDTLLNQKYLKYLWKVKKKLDNRNDITFVFGAGNASGDNSMGGNDMEKFKNHDIVSNNASLRTSKNHNLDNFEPMWLQLDYSIPMEDLKKTPTWIFCNKYLRDKVKLAYFDIGSVWGSSFLGESVTEYHLYEKIEKND